MADDFKKIDRVVKKGLLIDNDLNQFLLLVFPNTTERQVFIKRCLAKNRTRRMLLRAQWYTEIADQMVKIKESRPALQFIFLMAMAESSAKSFPSKSRLRPWWAVRHFFEHITRSDKQLLQNKFQRALLKPKHHNLRFSSIIRILYETRNKAVHGEDFWSFSLMREEDMKAHADYTHFSLMTEGTLNKKRVPIDTTLTYQELRDIFKRTAVENIKALL